MESSNSEYLRTYHLCSDDGQGLVEICEKKWVDFLVMHLDGETSGFEKVFDRVNIFVARRVETMNKLLAVCEKKKMDIRLLKEKIFELATQNGEKKILLFDPTLPALGEIFDRKNHPYFIRI